MSKKVLDALQSRFGGRVLSTHAQAGDETAVVEASALVEIAQWLKAEHAFNMPIDVTGVDMLGYPGRAAGSPRFEVVYHLYSLSKKHRIRLKVGVDGETPTVPSLYGVWKGVDWFEREVWDMYGVTFEGHPDLRRILMYEEFVGHPLRKDYPLRGYQPLVPVARLDPINEDPKLVHQDLNPDVG